MAGSPAMHDNPAVRVCVLAWWPKLPGDAVLAMSFRLAMTATLPPSQGRCCL